MTVRGPRSAAWRLALATAVAYAGTTAALGGLVFWATHTVVARQLDATIQESAESLVIEYRTEGESSLAHAIGSREARSADPLGYALFDARGRRVAGHLNTPRPPAGWSHLVFIDPLEGPDPARGLAIDLTPDRRLLVAADAAPLERVDQAILTLFGAAMVLVLALGTLGAWLVGSFLKNRLEPIAETADAIVRGALDRRVPVRGADDEFARVARSLNLMLERIATLVTNLRQVSSDLAHDLRTPLTRQRAALERGLRDDAPPEARREALALALEQSDEVLAIFDAILRIAEVEEGAARRRFARLDAGALAREIVEALAPAAEESGHALAGAAAPGQWIDGDRQLLAQALVNLVGNALRHTPPGTKVVVTVDPGPPGDGPRLRVADNGPGIPPADRGRVCERFVRLETARATPGHGLGLSLVKAVAALHGARLTLDDNAPGLAVRMAFPAPRDPPDS